VGFTTTGLRRGYVAAQPLALGVFVYAVTFGLAGARQRALDRGSTADERHRVFRLGTDRDGQCNGRGRRHRRVTRLTRRNLVASLSGVAAVALARAWIA
jgi:hypothetical protein